MEPTEPAPHMESAFGLYGAAIHPADLAGAVTSGLFNRGVCLPNGEEGYARAGSRQQGIVEVDMDGAYYTTETKVYLRRCPAIGKCALCPNR